MIAITVTAVVVINSKHSYRSNIGNTNNSKHSYRSNSGNTIYNKHSNDSNHSNSSSRNQ